MPKRYLHKSVTFDPDKKDEQELWEWLHTLPHGVFAKMTKEFWLGKMKESKEEE